MLVTITMEFLSLLFLTVIFCSFLIRSKNSTNESVFFFRMIAVTMISLILEIIATFTIAYRDQVSVLNMIVNRMYLTTIPIIMLQISDFIIFLYNDELKVNEKKGIILRRILDISCLLVILVDLFLPMYFANNSFGDRFGVYADGLAVTVAISYGIILFFIDFISCIRYRNYYLKQKVLCLIFYFLLLAGGIIARLVIPGITTICCEVTLICILI
ncbi:MAG: hypothetical protein K6E99_02995 [Bacilli bacterium]|nr:hypothetical protein [Bacilli bacterium]